MYYETVTRPKKDKEKAIKGMARLGNTYIRYGDVKKAVIDLKKQIGQVNMDLVLDAIDQIERK